MNLDELIKLSLESAAKETAMSQKQQADLLRSILREYEKRKGKQIILAFFRGLFRMLPVIEQ